MSKNKKELSELMGEYGINATVKQQREILNKIKEIELNDSNLKTVKNYANSTILDSTGNNPTVQYIYNLIKSGRVSGKEIDGVRFVDCSIEVEGISKIK